MELELPVHLATARLAELTRDQLLEVLEANSEGGIRINFAGKSGARRLARQVRPRVTRTVDKLGHGTADERSRNILIEGDNLQSMVTLYKERGHVDLILTDPPYNTGNDFRYNDRWEDDPNDPGLGEFVSQDDGARRTKWMRFMWPRLQMMKSMLKPGGVLAICIDHRELFRLGQMLDELFGEANRLAIINWQKATALKNDNTHVSTSTEYVLVYAKDERKARTAPLARTDKDNARYGNPDSDIRGDWREGPLHVRTWVEKDDYAIQSPFTGELHYPTGTSAWRYPKRDIHRWLEEWGTPYEERLLDDGKVAALVMKVGQGKRSLDQAAKRANDRLQQPDWPFIWFGRKGDGIPRRKIYLSEVKAGKIPETFWANEVFTELAELDSTSWAYTESGRSSDGAAELSAIVGPAHGFETVKPLRLFQKIIQIWCPPTGHVLDPFAGSGTSGHAVLALNASSDADRRFTLIEQGRPERGDSYAQTLTADRLRRACAGEWVKGSPGPLGGGFTYVRLGKKVDASALLRMERDEMLDTVIGSHFDASRRRGDQLIRVEADPAYRYLIARTTDNEGFFLVWDGPDENTDLTETVYETCADEAERSGLKPSPYHVYARLYRYQTDGVRFYQIPDRILSDFGLDMRSEPFTEDDEE